MKQDGREIDQFREKDSRQMEEDCYCCNNALYNLYAQLI